MVPGTILKNRDSSIFAILLKEEGPTYKYDVPHIIVDQLFIYSNHVELQKNNRTYAHFYNEATPTDYKKFVNILDAYKYEIKNGRIVKKSINDLKQLKEELFKVLKDERLREAVARLL